MLKKVLLLIIVVFMLVGCDMANSPTSIVENFFMKYQKVDNDIDNAIDSVLAEQNLTADHSDRYRKLLKNQYRNLSYEVKDESIDGNKATVIVEIEVVDYKNAISDLTFDSSIYSKDTFDEEKLNRLEAAKDKVKYTLELTLTKNDDGNWQMDALTNEQMKKIQGMY